jgi:DNA invertase Pin-like site-specific DNA recombinase
MNKTDPQALSPKITSHHLERLAYVYIRQSSAKQVERNRESQVNQYQMAERAQSFGWATDRIRVIDSDLGLSGRSSQHRDGFKELVAEVTLGHVGIIFGYEVSRLARNNSDWYHLLDLAAVFGTLIADVDGLYDTRLYNDRLILGLKGTMSEAELHLLRLRLSAGRMSKVRRGAYRLHLPTGLVRLPDETVVKDPDDQVRHTLELVFSKFAEIGSCQKVIRYFHQQNMLLPRRHPCGYHTGQLFWKPATNSSIYAILTNPAYAGAFAYGRRQAEPTRQVPGRPNTGYLHRPLESWHHIQQDVYPAYITWEQYRSNLVRLRQNATRVTAPDQRTSGAAREGAAILAGLAICGICGYRMRVIYRSAHRYYCDGRCRSRGEKSCASLHGPSIDTAVTEAFFEAIRPAQLDALEAVLAAQAREREQLLRQWQERLKRARYEAHLAQRQYDAADPDNRLVTGELERRWEEKLRELRSIEEAYERFQQTPATQVLEPGLRRQLEHISEELPALWSREEFSNAYKKELLRCLISRVVLRRTAPDEIEVRIVWVSGHFTLVHAQPPIRLAREVRGYEKMVERIGSLWQAGVKDDKEIAEQLTKDGFHSARSVDVSPALVQKVRVAHGWRSILRESYRALEIGKFLTVRGLAARLGVNREWVYWLIRNGRIESKYIHREPDSPVWLIRDDPKLIKKLRQMRLKRTH